MNRLRLLIRNYFGFSKTETNGFMVLVPLLVLMLFVPTIYVQLYSREYDPNEYDQKMLDSLVAAWNNSIVELSAPVKEDEPMVTIKLTDFDPNSASVEELMGLGTPAFLARRIDNYRKKGGQFRIKSDLAKIYDFPDSLYQVLAPFIQLPESLPKKKPWTEKRAGTSNGAKEKTARVEVPKALPLLLNLNESDTTALKQLRGIGSGYSRRIVKYRNLLGGFVAKEQLAEVYGISDSLYQSLEPHIFVDDSLKVRQINVNIANFKTLNAHPYISYKQAGEILNTRSKKGKFRSLSDLMRVQGLDSAGVARLAPYISY